MTRIRLTVDGREVSFSEEELVSIVQEHFRRKEEEKKLAIPREGVPFKIDTRTFDLSIFSIPRDDKQQEFARRLIWEACAEVQKNPMKYAKVFYTLFPKKTWDHKKVEDLRKMGEQDGRSFATWVEQALEWAQRITNGETWEAVCNDKDPADWFRIIEWKDGKIKLVGGCKEGWHNYSATAISVGTYDDKLILDSAVPLYVLYE